MSNLKQEIDTYNRHLSDLLSQYQGKFVVIKGSEIAGIRDTYLDALTTAYNRYGLTSFLVKQITATEPVVIFYRGLNIPSRP